MSAIKIVEFSFQGFSPLAQFLKFYSEKKSWGWSFEIRNEFSKATLNEFSAALVAPMMSSQIVSQLSVLSSQVRSLQALDSFFKEDGAWYPRLVLHEALRLLLVEYANDLDIRAPAFAIGDDEEVRVVASVLAEMGIAEIYLVGDIDKLDSQREILSRSQLGIRFHVLPPEDLTLQAVSAGIVVNTFDLSDSKSLLTDLSYFNYMKRAGYALDFNVLQKQNTLLEEAERADLRVLKPVQLESIKAKLWLERLRPSEKFLEAEIQSLWLEFLNSASV